jgi:hypothetical protein
MKKIFTLIMLLFSVSLTSCEVLDALGEQAEVYNAGYNIGYEQGYIDAACGYYYDDIVYHEHPSFVSGYKAGYSAGFAAGRGQVLYSPESPEQSEQSPESAQSQQSPPEMQNVECETQN